MVNGACGRQLMLAAITSIAAVLGCAMCVTGASGAEPTHQGNSLLNNKKAIEAGRILYAQHCMVCHGVDGSRGPDLFNSKLSDQEFIETVMAGRTGSRGEMPSWGGFLTVTDVQEIQAFVRSRSHF